MPTILFVCSGNVFRSMSAAFAMSAAAPAEGGYIFTSAGTHAKPGHRLRDDVRERLQHWGIDPSAHEPRKLDSAVVAQADLIVAMGTDHRDFIKREFNVNAILFSEICHGKAVHLPDLWEAVPDFFSNKQAARTYVNETIDMIVSNAETFLKRLPAFLRNNP